jgi:hypothetical protein
MTRRNCALTLIVLLALAFIACPPPHPPVPPPGPVYVTVNVCAESGLLPNEYCPSREDRKFIKGQEPTEICAVHVKPKTKVANPWHPGGELVAASFTLYSTLAYKALNEAKLDALDEAMAVDGIAVRRDFAFYSDFGTAWEGTGLFPWLADWTWNEEYFAQLDRRLQMWCGDRDGTQIISILDACSLYDGQSFETNPLNKLAARGSEVYAAGPARERVIAFAVELWNRTKKYGQRIIIETRNEGEQIVGYDGLRDFDHAMIAALRSAGCPPEQIQIGFFDSSLFYATLSEDLEGRGLASTHRINSEVDVNWYRDSPGKQGLMKLGDYPCCDGASFGVDENPPAYRALGLTFSWLVGTPAENVARRPNVNQIAYIMATMRGLGFGRYEHLSASAFQHSVLPDLDDAITLGRAERLAMKLAASPVPNIVTAMVYPYLFDSRRFLHFPRENPTLRRDAVIVRNTPAISIRSGTVRIIFLWLPSFFFFPVNT